MVDDTETVPPPSGEVDAPMRVIVCSTRVRLIGEGDVVVARDVADLLLALDEHRRTTIVVDVPFSTVELGFLARLARDFPPNVAMLVQGVPARDRRAFHDEGIYRPQFDAVDEGVLPQDDRPIDRGELIEQVREKLAHQLTPLLALLER